MNFLAKRYLSILKEEVVDNNLLLEIFNNMNLNKAYSKIVKISLLLVIFLKFILTDYQYDNNLKMTLKKLFAMISDSFINVIDMFIMTPLLSSGKEVKLELQEKFFKFSKTNKLNKKLSSIDLCSLIVKMTDGCINSIKLFSKYCFFLI